MSHRSECKTYKTPGRKHRKKIFAIRDGKVSLNKTQKAQNIKGKNDKILFIFNDKFKTFALQKMPLGKWNANHWLEEIVKIYVTKELY